MEHKISQESMACRQDTVKRRQEYEARVAAALPAPLSTEEAFLKLRELFSHAENVSCLRRSTKDKNNIVWSERPKPIPDTEEWLNNPLPPLPVVCALPKKRATDTELYCIGHNHPDGNVERYSKEVYSDKRIALEAMVTLRWTPLNESRIHPARSTTPNLPPRQAEKPTSSQPS